MTQKAYIETIIDDKRLSTRELLQIIYEKIDQGYDSFEIQACGQHDIGGPLWSKTGIDLTFNVKNPGQRCGSMGMPNTNIIIEGSAPADVGWLNSGADIVIKGDSGDTTAHCAASGRIFVAGKAGTRSGALMKYDPKYPKPEFWVLKNTGSFSFEFMSGGVAVVCGVDCENEQSILGNRSCVGMVGGTIFARGNINNISNDILIINLDDKDKEFLFQGLKSFLEKIDRVELLETLIDWSKWQKIIAKTYEERKIKEKMSLKDFRQNLWIKNGIFSDFYKDDFEVNDLIGTGKSRLRTPHWRNNLNLAPCESHCPIGIPTQKRINLIRNNKLKDAIELILDYSPFPASVCGNVCPNLCMEECNRALVDEPIKVKQLGTMSRDVQVEKITPSKKQKVAIIGSGVSGLTAAWHLTKMGYIVELFEQDDFAGGKLKQVIPTERLSSAVIDAEIKRIEDLGVKINLNYKINKNEFNKIKTDFDAVIIAIGSHNPVVIPFKGHEKLIGGLDFLKKVKRGEKFEIDEKVCVIGAGNAAMDVISSAYKLGAKEVTAIDIQKPSAFEKEINHVKSLGAKILYPCNTKEITDEGVLLENGMFIEAKTVIIAVGDRPIFDFINNFYLNERQMPLVNEFMQSELDENIFFVGDTLKQGLFTNAIADARKVAINLDNKFSGKQFDKFKKAPMLPRDKIKPEFYHSYDHFKISQSAPQDEKIRCMSCGLCRDCEFCMHACPQNAIEKYVNEQNETIYVSNEERCIGCGICAGICPCGIWEMEDNFLEQKDN